MKQDTVMKQEDMIDQYLERGEMFVLNDNGIKAECVVTKEDNGIYELKNIAVLPDYQRKGYGRRLIEFVITYYADCTVIMETGTSCSAVSNRLRPADYTHSAQSAGRKASYSFSCL